MAGKSYKRSPKMVQQKLKLKIELIPSSSWQSNLRGILKPSMWNAIRNNVYLKNNSKCVICSRIGRLHAHEVWEFDDVNHIQKLEDIIPVCYLCHMVKHIGFSSLNQKATGIETEKLIKHFMNVNKCDRKTYQSHLRQAMEKFYERSRFEWQLDLTKLKDFE